MESSLLDTELKANKTIGFSRTHGVQLGEKKDISESSRPLMMELTKEYVDFNNRHHTH